MPYTGSITKIKKNIHYIKWVPKSEISIEWHTVALHYWFFRSLDESDFADKQNVYMNTPSFKIIIHWLILPENFKYTWIKNKVYFHKVLIKLKSTQCRILFRMYQPPPPYRIQQILPTLADLSNNNGHAYILNVWFINKEFWTKKVNCN